MPSAVPVLAPPTAGDGVVGAFPDAGLDAGPGAAGVDDDDVVAGAGVCGGLGAVVFG